MKLLESWLWAGSISTPGPSFSRRNQVIPKESGIVEDVASFIEHVWSATHWEVFDGFATYLKCGDIELHHHTIHLGWNLLFACILVGEW